MIVVGRVYNDQYLSIAFGVVENEKNIHEFGLLSCFLRTLKKTDGVSFLTSKR